MKSSTVMYCTGSMSGSNANRAVYVSDCVTSSEVAVLSVGCCDRFLAHLHCCFFCFFFVVTQWIFRSHRMIGLQNQILFTFLFSLFFSFHSTPSLPLLILILCTRWRGKNIVDKGTIWVIPRSFPCSLRFFNRQVHTTERGDRKCYRRVRINLELAYSKN